MSKHQWDELRWLRSVKRPATPPDVDVTADVLRTLQEHRPAQPIGVWLTMVLASWALAAVSLVVVGQLIIAWHEPMRDLMAL